MYTITYRLHFKLNTNKIKYAIYAHIIEFKQQLTTGLLTAKYSQMARQTLCKY